MDAILICPAERLVMSPLSQGTLLVDLPLLGQSLLEYWLAHLALSQAKHVLVLIQHPHDDPNAIDCSGTRWGLKVETTVEAQELTSDEALSKYGGLRRDESNETVVEVLDHFPGVSEPTLFGSHADFFRALQVWMPRALTPDRVGMRQVCPGVWIGVSARVSPQAKVHAPCWIGQHAVVKAGAVLGPGSMVEDGAFIDSGAEVSASWIASHTYVGRLARVTNSLAWGNWLVNWHTGSATQVPDPFVLSALRLPSKQSDRFWFRCLRGLNFRQKEPEAGPWDRVVVVERE